jgi:hypothetical protein
MWYNGFEVEKSFQFYYVLVVEVTRLPGENNWINKCDSLVSDYSIQDIKLFENMLHEDKIQTPVTFLNIFSQFYYV